MNRTHSKRVQNPKVLKKTGITMPQTRKAKYDDEECLKGKDKGYSTYQEDFKDFSWSIEFRRSQHEQDQQASAGLYVPVAPSSPLTTTVRRNYKGEPGSPAKSCRPKWFPPDQTRQLGTTGYSYDYNSKPLPQQRSPPPSKIGNVLHTYPSNVLLPYTRPEQVITTWKPFKVLPPVNNVNSSELLESLTKQSLTSTYRDDYLSIH